MANICCDDVYFYSTDNPNGLNALWDDLNKAISFNTPLSNGWLGDWFAFKEIPTENIYLRGNIIDMDKNEHSVFIALSTAWTPLYESVSNNCRNIPDSFCTEKYRTWLWNLL